MNDIVTKETSLSEQKLNEMIADVERRKKQLATQSGISAAQDEMLKLFAQLSVCGYHAPKDMDKRFMAKVWSAQLQQYIAIYGFRVLRRAVAEFINSDSREVKMFPTVSDIIGVMKSIGVNPKAELAKKDLERRVRLMEEEHRRDYIEARKRTFTNSELRKRYDALVASGVIGS